MMSVSSVYCPIIEFNLVHDNWNLLGKFQRESGLTDHESHSLVVDTMEVCN